MTWTTALRARLIADTAVAAKVGTRIDWAVRPQGAPLPAIVLTKVSDGRPQHLKGFETLRQSRIQIDVLASSRSQVEQITEAVIAAIAGPFNQSGVQFSRTFIDTVTDRGASTDTGFVHRDLIDALIWHN